MKCNICGNENNSIYFSNVKGYGINEKYNLLKCNKCGLIFTKQNFTEDELRNYYNNQNIAFNGMGGENFISDYLKNKEKIWEQLSYESRHQEILKYNPKAKSILDVGCGAGLFIDFLKSRGFNVFGIELSKWGFETATQKLNLTVFNDDLGKINKQSDFPQVDVITMYDVLEHSLDSNLMIEKTKDILNPGGILIINLPNIESYISKLTGKYWNKLIPPNHLSHFSINSLDYLLNKHKFSVLSQNTNNGDSKELISEIIISPLKTIGNFLPFIAYGYENRDENVNKVKFSSVYLVKSIRRIGRMFGFIGKLIKPSLIKNNLGEGLHIIAQQWS